MTTLEKMQKLVDKETGFGISISTIARYCGYHRTSISHYLAGNKPVSVKQENAIENGIKNLLNDLQNFMNQEG